MNEAIAAARDMSLSAYLDMCNIPKQGQWYVCPFCGSGTNDNKTSAFRIYHDKRFCCHSCQEKGGLIDFVMKINKVGFKDAVRILGLEIASNVIRPVYVQIKWRIPFHIDLGVPLEWAVDTAKTFGLNLIAKPLFIDARSVLKKAHTLTREEICAYEIKFPYHRLNNMVEDLRVDDSTMMHIVNEIFADGGYYDVSHEDWPVLVYYLTRFFPPNTFNMQPPEAYN